MPPPPGQDDPKALSFEAHLEALEAVVGDLEGDALSLEASISRYQEGVSHLSACRRILDAAERRLTELVATAEGGAVETALEVGPEGLVPAPPGASGPAPRPPPPPPASPTPPSPPSSAPSAAPRAPVRATSKGPRKPSPLPPPSSEPGDDLPF